MPYDPWRVGQGLAAAVGGVGLSLVLADCSGSGGPSAPQTGSLVVTVTAPAGVTPSVAVSGPGGYHHLVSATTTLNGLAAGSYAVAAARVAGNNSIVGTIDTATVTGSPATVVANASAAASAAYAQVPGTGGLWVVSTRTPGNLFEFTAAQLSQATTDTPAVTIASGSQVSLFLIADPNGNLWVSHVNPAAVVEFASAALAAGGSPTPVVTLTANDTSLHGPAGLAFDAGGNLWVANATGSRSSNSHSISSRRAAARCRPSSSAPTARRYEDRSPWLSIAMAISG